MGKYKISQDTLCSKRVAQNGHIYACAAGVYVILSHIINLTKGENMKYFILSKFRYIRGYEHDMPANEMCKNGFDNLEKAKEAVAALELLNHRPDMVSFIILQETSGK